MIVDTVEGSIGWSINDEYQGVAFRDKALKLSGLYARVAIDNGGGSITELKTF